MRNTFLLSCLLSILILQSCRKDTESMSNTTLDEELQRALETAADGQGTDFFKFPASTDFASIPQDPLNPITEAKVHLGQMLFHETGLAMSPLHVFSEGTYSCASCHFAGAGFQANRVQGIGDGGIGFGVNGEGRQNGAMYEEDALDVQPIRTPSAMNGAYQTNMLWNGQFGATGVNLGTEEQWTEGTPKAVNHLGYEGLEVQAIAGLGVHRQEIAGHENILLWYQTYFDESFPDFPSEERYTKETAGLAIAAFERTVMANEAPFQKWLQGDRNAMTDAEKRGAVLFFDKASCSTCHTGPALNSMEFHALGMKDLFECPEDIFLATENSGVNKGRADFTKEEEDLYKFKVPQLYNLADSPFYGHGSSFRSIKEVVEYKNLGTKQNIRVPFDQLADEFVPLELTDVEVEDLTAFLKYGLRDPNLARYQPSSVVSGNCFPNADPMSINQLGCD